MRRSDWMRRSGGGRQKGSDMALATVPADGIIPATWPFVAAMIADPTDPLPRLAMADLLEECGEKQHAFSVGLLRERGFFCCQWRRGYRLYDINWLAAKRERHSPRPFWLVARVSRKWAPRCAFCKTRPCWANLKVADGQWFCCREFEGRRCTGPRIYTLWM